MSDPVRRKAAGSRRYPWGIAVLAATGTAVIYLVLPEFAPQTLAGNHDVFLFGVCLGLAVGVAVRVPRAVAPVVGCVAALAFVVQLRGDDVPTPSAVGLAVVVGVEIGFLAYVLRLGGIWRLARPVDVLILGVIALGVAVVAAVVVVLVLHASGLLGAESVAHDVRGWVLGDVFGVFCLAPALFTARSPARWSWKRAPEFAVAATGTALVTYGLFWAVTKEDPGLLGWPYMVVLGPLWIAVRMGAAAVAPVSAVVLWMAAVGTVNGHGAITSAAPLPHDRLAAVQLFAIVMSGVLLLLGVLRDERVRSIERITDSERLLREVVDGMDAFVFAKSYTDDVDPDGHYVLANRKWLTEHELDHADLPQARARDLFPAEAAETFLANDRLVMSTNAPLEAQEPGAGPRNESRTFSSSKFPLRGSDGRPWGVGGVVIDITERVAAERSLAEHSEQLRAVLDIPGTGSRGSIPT